MGLRLRLDFETLHAWTEGNRGIDQGRVVVECHSLRLQIMLANRCVYKNWFSPAIPVDNLISSHLVLSQQVLTLDSLAPQPQEASTMHDHKLEARAPPNVIILLFQCPSQLPDIFIHHNYRRNNFRPALGLFSPHHGMHSTLSPGAEEAGSSWRLHSVCLSTAPNRTSLSERNLHHLVSA